MQRSWRNKLIWFARNLADMTASTVLGYVRFKSGLKEMFEYELVDFEHPQVS